MIGEEFKWFLGIVEDVEDPLQLGRAKVRVISEHEDVQTEDLPWAFVMTPTTSASVTGVGETPSLIAGSRIVGFYLDDLEKQLMMIMGTFPTIPDMNDDKHSFPYLARGKQTLEKKLIGPEPKSSYAAKYPYNKVIQTRSGHVIEYDDTPENERIHIFHKSGSYVEINPNGSMVIKSVDKKYDIVGGDHEMFVKGNANIKVEGKCDIHANKAASISSDVGLKLKAPGGVTVVGGSLTVGESIATATGATGSFTTATGIKVNIQNGIVTSIG